MTTIPSEVEISARAGMIARGLLATKHAAAIISMEDGRPRIRGFIDIDAGRVLRSKLLSGADELQQKLIDAMERAGR
jgi:hypothetical protein